MKMIKPSDAAILFNQIRALEIPEKERRLINLERQQRAAAEQAELDRLHANQRGTLRPLMHMSVLDYMHFMQTHGHDELHSKEFARYHTKKHAEQRVQKLY